MKMKLLKITQSNIDKLGRRVLTMFNGNVNTVTAIPYGPYGEDSNPIENSIGAYSDTELNGKEICVGIMNKNAKAELGERRLYCTDDSGNFKFNIWLRSDGTVLIGDSEIPSEFINYAVKYNEALTELNKMESTLNDLITKWNAFVANYVPGSPTTTGLPSTLAGSNVTLNTSDFTALKNEKIKYNE